MLTTLGHEPSSATLSTPLARGTHRQKHSPLGNVSITTRFLLHSSSCTESVRVLAEAALGWKVANESLDCGVLKSRAACVGSNRPTIVPEMVVFQDGPGVCIAYLRAATNAKRRSLFVCISGSSVFVDV